MRHTLGDAFCLGNPAVVVFLDQGRSYASTGSLHDACAAFRQVLSLDPEDSRAHYNLADTLDDLGKSAEAAEHWRAYLKHDMKSPWADHARKRLRKA